VNSDGLSSPEQFGVWDVDGLGLCVAFRGTASTEDVLIDVNITPTPLETSRNMRGGLGFRAQLRVRVQSLSQACSPQHVTTSDIMLTPLETSRNMHAGSELGVYYHTLLVPCSSYKRAAPTRWPWSIGLVSGRVTRVHG